MFLYNYNNNRNYGRSQRNELFLFFECRECLYRPKYFKRIVSIPYTAYTYIFDVRIKMHT